VEPLCRYLIFQAKRRLRNRGRGGIRSVLLVLVEGNQLLTTRGTRATVSTTMVKEPHNSRPRSLL
jgi:hypothetical protein